MQEALARGWLNAPNLVTLVRVALTPMVVAAILSGRNKAALLLFGAAAATDFLDGFLARFARASTRVGRYLDPIADKVLLCAVYVALGIAGSVPMWFVGIVFGRDLALVVASAIAMKLTRYDNYRPTIWGKISTLCQIGAAVTAMLSRGTGLPGNHGVQAAVLVATAATLWSAVHYAWRGISFFRRDGQAPANESVVEEQFPKHSHISSKRWL